MLSDKCLRAYRKQYPNDDCGYEESTGDIVISRASDDKSFYCAAGEDDKTFLDRLERSKEVNRNLFYEEWDEFKYEDDCYY